MTLIKQILFRTPYIDYAEAHSVEYICFMLKKPSPLPQEFKMVSKLQRIFLDTNKQYIQYVYPYANADPTPYCFSLQKSHALFLPNLHS